jgi:phosphoglycolate phosphatase
MQSNGTLVLDLDGTLADTNRDLIPVLNRSTAPEGVAPVGMEEVGHVVGHGARAMIARAFHLRGAELSPEVHERVFQRFLADYEENLARETVLFSGVIEALDALDADGWRFAVCTNKMQRFAVKLLGELGIESRFAAISGGDTFHFRKPDPRHLTETIAMAGGDAANSIMVGDSATDIATARAASIPVIAVDFGYSERPIAEYGPDRLISSFSELPGAVVDICARSHGHRH